ncbi:DUF4760 domain-containing protein [Aquimarina sp. Aq78]|uniref:DUF4760 domain-containing protein n=1 Tax=Aquimarina sp. Aq78 TaxID=1191889 RepID=UPI000D0ED6F8|nr:DUF4760 domain-containing protein [Aquimarina sp. Aq78]
METFEISYKITHIIILSISAYLIIITIRKNQEWNRRKTTHEFINDLVSGDYLELSKILTIDLKVEVNNVSEDYSKSIIKLQDETDKKLLQHTVTRIFNLFEVLSISIKNKVVDEDICYDFLGLMYTGYYRWGVEFIEEKKRANNEKRTFINFENQARKWQKRIDEEISYKTVPGKPEL